MTDLVIYGTGGLAREVAEIAMAVNERKATYRLLGFLDDNPDKHGQTCGGLPILGGEEWMRENRGVGVVLGIGNPAVKRRLAAKLDALEVPVATLVHPDAWIGQRVTLGKGSVVCAHVSVTTDIVIGAHVILNLNVTVGHDAVLGDFVTVAPGVNISGNVTVGEGCDLGTGGAVIQGKTIGPWSVVGAGAVVVQDLAANVTAVGVPAKVIKTREEGWYR